MHYLSYLFPRPPHSVEGEGGDSEGARGRAQRAVLSPADPTTTFSCRYPSRLPYCPRWPETSEIIQIMLRPLLRLYNPAEGQRRIPIAPCPTGSYGSRSGMQGGFI
jgi:hypothetical protein